MKTANKCNDCFLHRFAMHFGKLLWRILKTRKTIYKQLILHPLANVHFIVTTQQ